MMSRDELTPMIPGERPQSDGPRQTAVGIAKATPRLSSDDIEMSEDASTSDGEDPIKPKWEKIDCDLYGASFCAVVKDTYWLFKDPCTEHPTTRWCRLFRSVFLVVFMVGLQLFLVDNVMELVTSRAVYDIQQSYKTYEEVMYNGTEFRPYMFNTMDEDQKDTICAVPFSQPQYFGAVLLIWAISVMSDVRRVLELCRTTFIDLPTVKAVSMMIAADTDDDPDTCGIVGLTMSIKIFVAILMLCRFVVDCELLWLGSRWLAATPDFGELLLNAVALEFILFLREVFFKVVISARLQRETQNMSTKAPKYQFQRLPQFATMLYLVISFAWAILYMTTFETVLPNYKWDIQVVCSQYLTNTSVLHKFDRAPRVSGIGRQV